MSSFIKASKSVPPASTKAPPEAAPSRLKACFVLVGLVHHFFFKECIADAHGQGTVTTALRGLQIDDQSTILHCDHLSYLDDSSFHVHFDIGHLHSTDAAVGEIGWMFLIGIFTASGDGH